MAELHYKKEIFAADLNMDFKVTDNFTLKTGYQYENNSNYDNHKISTGISYILG
jgi:putative surface-exposed virulence protein